MKDMCKLLLAEKRLGKSCRKIFAVSDKAAVSHLSRSWQGEFARIYGIEILIVEISEKIKQKILDAQEEQYR